jgi:DNA replication protein DnaC
MLTEQTVERLSTLRLGTIADACLAQQGDPAAAALSFDERLGMLVDAEQLARENRALRRRLKEAKLRLGQACLADLDHSNRKLDRAVIRHLATDRWVAEHQDILITGATAVGKTFSACTLGQQACRQSHRVIYRRIPRLFPELTLARGDGTYPSVLARFARVEVDLQVKQTARRACPRPGLKNPPPWWKSPDLLTWLALRRAPLRPAPIPS